MQVPLCGSHAELWIGWLNGGLCASDVRVLYSAAGGTGSLIRLRGVSINLISFFSKGVLYSIFPLIRSSFGVWRRVAILSGVDCADKREEAMGFLFPLWRINWFLNKNHGPEPQRLYL